MIYGGLRLQLYIILVRLAKQQERLHDAAYFGSSGLPMCIYDTIETAIMFIDYAKYLQYCRLSARFYTAMDLSTEHIPEQAQHAQDEEYLYFRQALRILRRERRSEHIIRALIGLGYTDSHLSEHTPVEYFEMAIRFMHVLQCYQLRADAYLGLALTDTVERVDKWCAMAVQFLDPLRESAAEMKSHLILRQKKKQPAEAMQSPLDKVLNILRSGCR